MRRTVPALCLAFLAGLFASTASAWGPEGHRIVGAIADRRLANTETGRKVALLLDGFTLEKAALIPDEIKGWDKEGPDRPGIFHYTSRPRIDEQLTSFWRANPPVKDRTSPIPSHHWFHYTDVPILFGAKYSEGKAGRSKWDIVQMTKYCVRVLQGDEPEENPRKITKSIAVILLAHYVGDIHQPMHVGAQFFDRTGQPADPEKEPEALEDQGGNTITLFLEPRPGDEPRRSRPNLHSFWDNDTVLALMPPVPREMEKEERRPLVDAGLKEFVEKLAQEEPKSWRTTAPAGCSAYSEKWADEILPLAREAHERLRFERIEPRIQKGELVAAGHARERRAPDGVRYLDWASRVAREKLTVAGWRLADLLEKALK